MFHVTRNIIGLFFFGVFFFSFSVQDFHSRAQKQISSGLKSTHNGDEKSIIKNRSGDKILIIFGAEKDFPHWSG